MTSALGPRDAGADLVALDPGRRATAGAWLGGALGAALGLGLTLAVRGLQAVAADAQAVVGAGEALGVLLLGGALLGVGPALSRATRPGPRRAARLAVGTMLLAGLLLVPALLGRLLDDAVAVAGPAALLAGLAVTGLAGGVLVRGLGGDHGGHGDHAGRAHREAGLVPVPRWVAPLAVAVPLLLVVVYLVAG